MITVYSLLLMFCNLLVSIKKRLTKQLMVSLIGSLPIPPYGEGPIYRFRTTHETIHNPRSRLSYRNAEDLAVRYYERRNTTEFANRRDYYAFFDTDFLADKFIYGSTNYVIMFKQPHFGLIIFLAFCTFWFIVAFFAGYKDVGLGFMAGALCLTFVIFLGSIKIHFMISYFLSAMVLFLVGLFIVPQLIYCYEWLVFMTFLTIGGGLGAISVYPGIIGGLMPLVGFIPLIIVPMSYVYTILMNDVYVPQFDPETELWEEEETKGGQEPEVKLIRLVLSEQSRIRKIRMYLKNLGEMEEIKLEDAPVEEVDKAKETTIIYAGPATDPDNPLPFVSESEAKAAIAKARVKQVEDQIVSDQGGQASIGEQKRIRFINKRIADFEKEMLTAPTEEMRREYASKITTLKQKKLDDNIDTLRYEKAEREQQMIRGLHEPSYKDLILHAQDTTTLELRIQNRERALEITAQSPVFLGDGSSAADGGGALQVLRVKDVKLFDDEEVAVAKQSEAYKEMQKTMEEIGQLRSNPYKEFTGSREEFNKVGDVGLSEETTPEAKLMAYNNKDGSWDLFTTEEKETMKKEGLWPPSTIKGNPVKNKYEKLK